MIQDVVQQMITSDRCKDKHLEHVGHGSNF